MVILKIRLENNLSKQKDISALIIEIEENRFSSSQKIREISHQNQRLEEIEEELKKKRDFKNRENLILKDKLALVSATLEGEVAIRTGERDKIKEEVKSTETEYSDLTQKIEEALKWKAKRVEYNQEMVILDRENAALRKKVLELRDKLESLKQ